MSSGPVSAYQYPSENQNLSPLGDMSLSVSAYQYPSENQNTDTPSPTWRLYQLINIHQRTKTPFRTQKGCTGISLSISIREPKRLANDFIGHGGISLSISIREPKLDEVDALILQGISLSISIREPKPSTMFPLPGFVSAYQYPSENQNDLALLEQCDLVSAYQYPSENQNIRLSSMRPAAVSAYQYPSENQNAT